MPARLRKHLTFANVASSIALFVSIGGGTAFAVVAANQVNSQSIVDGQVKSPDLGTNSVGTGKILDGTVEYQDLAPNSVGSSKVGNHTLQARDLAPGVGGPLQFDSHADENVQLDLPEVMGLHLRVKCHKDSNQDVNLDARLVGHNDSNDNVGVSGFGVVDGHFKSITAQDLGEHILTSYGRINGVGITANFDVLAHDLASPNKWTHWVIGLYNDGSGHGCGVWGNVSPPSN